MPRGTTKPGRNPRPRRTLPRSRDEFLAEIAEKCADDYDAFNSIILGRPPYWSRQIEICESLRKYRTTVVVTGNGVGKSYNAAGNLLGYASSHPRSRTVATAPTLGQLSGVLWSEVEAAYQSAERNGWPLGGRLRRLSLSFGEKWQVEAFGSGSVESKSGRHAADLLALVDEASGTPEAVLEAIDSLNPSRYLYYGNPIRPEGRFYELAEHSGDNPSVNVIRIASLESPDIELDRSPRGMADRGWLEDSRAKWGEDSLWWLVHVLAKFPSELSDGLLPLAWLNLAGDTLHVDAGDRWLGIDLGEGTGGDPSELVVRDDRGILDHDSSNVWSLETTAERARALSDQHGIEPARIVYDQAGIGADFDSRLRAVGLNGCRAYKGARAGGDRFKNLRSASAWRLRQRLDPKRTVRTNGRDGRGVWVPQHPFSIPKPLLERYRTELVGLRYQLGGDEVALEPKEAFVKRLKKSPNFLDALIMTFAFPYA